MDYLCDLTLDKLGSLSYKALVEECSHFDVLTGVRIPVVSLRMNEALTENIDQISWRRALDTIDFRIGSRSQAESQPLRDQREVIAKAYADLQANLLGYGPSLVASLALSVDGRTEESSYPNLLLHTERERYGL